MSKRFRAVLVLAVLVLSLVASAGTAAAGGNGLTGTPLPDVQTLGISWE